ncbi:NUDIX domain-containing protein [Candidatus Parcubacteria bacterium]|nr:NUDIX domain-containing protein [Candidatus Parcubacteria bacterium]
MSGTERFRAYVAAHLVLHKDGQVLLLRRFNTGYQDGNYSVVAGHMEGRETAEQCIIREAKEEAGITLTPQDVHVVHVMHRLSIEDREYVDIYLTADTWSGEITNMEPEKCDALTWFSINDLPVNILPQIQLALNNIATGKFYGEIGWENDIRCLAPDSMRQT